MEQEKLKILTSFLGPYTRSGGEVLYSCPFCKHHKKKLSVNIHKNVFKCWICDANGKSLSKLVRKFGNADARFKWSKFEDKIEIGDFDNLFEEQKPELEVLINLPANFVSLANKTLPITAKSPLKYLSERGVSKKDILRWKIGYCSSGEYANRIIIPSFNKDGYVNYFVARSWIDEFPRYKNPQASKNIIFNELFVDWTKPIILTEGVFDAVKAGNAIPLLGSTMKENSKVFQEIVKREIPVYLALDPDAQKKQDWITEILLSYDVPVYSVDVSGYKDVGEMEPEVFQDRLNKATFIDQTNYLLTKMLRSVK
jgi:DNA primase